MGSTEFCRQVEICCEENVLLYVVIVIVLETNLLWSGQLLGSHSIDVL